MSSIHASSPAEGFVYVMECAGFYKIGWTGASSRIRRMCLQVGNPLPVTLVGVIEGSQLVESDWHDAFRDKQVRGEWFALTAEDVARILHDSAGIDWLPGEDDIA